MKTPDTAHRPRLFLSCDWGTSSFRLRPAGLEEEVGTATKEIGISDSDGISHIFTEWQKQRQSQGARERIDFFQDILLQKIRILQKKCPVPLDNLPVVLSGMASSSIGLKELPYSPLPLDLEIPDLQFEVFESSDSFPHKLILVSGVSGPHDVMRGEETELLGIIGTADIQSGICIITGTHSKHLTIRDRVLTGFSTWMTGELFNLLSTQSILANSISKPAAGNLSDAFISGLKKSADSMLLHSLFEIRADDLLHQTNPQNNYEYLSGLLIGTELKHLSGQAPDKIILSGEPVLRSLYATACRFFDLDFNEITDRDLTIRGHRYILNHLNKNISLS